jgi:Arginine kinase
MDKWYDDSNLDYSIFISSRLRLARNLSEYPFSIVLDQSHVHEIIDKTLNAIKSAPDEFRFINIDDISNIEQLANFEQHNISQYFLQDKNPRGFLINKNESLSIMINEEDHIRIQSICPGDNIYKAFELSDNIDDILSEKLDYAFDNDFGYLTSCPTNVGTGLRASFMLHLPMLEKTSQLKNLIQIISKFGMTVRGLHGEGTQPMGSIYQISNQITLGKSEQDIIKNLRNVTQQIIDQEIKLRENALKEKKLEMEDKIFRSFGILSNCKIINTLEAMSLLSDVRLGYCMGLDVPKFKFNIYKIMMNIQPGLLQKNYGRRLDETQMNEARADYIKKML